ncbi:hypothetical protein LJC35_00355 [Parabacteroides sp. OttesenSCG-928-N08]|nr:hypothetical protein [Parabacteroides sp. OttesenSCG-928-N08]
MNNNRDKESILDAIKKTDKEGNIYWSSRELWKALEYSTYQKFLKLIGRAKCKMSESGYEENQHFIPVVKKVQIGSGANREIEYYLLTGIACRFIAECGDQKKALVQVAKRYFSADANCDVSGLLASEENNSKSANKQYWKRLTEISSERYKNKMQRLCRAVTEEEMDLLEGFRRDDSFLGNPAQHHIVYKLGNPLVSKDGSRAYEFLIEYEIYDPTVGIYYGCRGLTLEGNHDEQIEIFNSEWEEIASRVALILDNTFPGKQFQSRFRLTNNANDNTYWPFWITLYEEEDIVCVAARATKIIKDVYRSHFKLEETQEIISLGSINAEKKEPQQYNRKETVFSTNTAFTKNAYVALLDQVISKKSNQREKVEELFDQLLTYLIREKMLFKVEEYEKAFAVTKDMSNVEFSYLVVEFFKCLNENKLNMNKSKAPWKALQNVFLSDDTRFGGDVLKNSYIKPDEKANKDDPEKKKELIARRLLENVNLLFT